MTQEQKIKALSNKIREALPYLMELSEGCIIENILDDLKFKVNGVYNELNVRKWLYCSDLQTEFNQSSSLIFRPKYHIIIGHEPLLNDVLAWVLKITKPYYCQFRDGVFFVYYSDLSFIEYSCNLEKPYLKDQSVDLIDFLYSLIEKKQ